MASDTSVFTAFGLFWQRSLWELDRYWILGWKPNYSAWRAAPEKAHYLLNDQAAIYILHGPDREILYVGQTGSGDSRLGTRLWQHAHSEKRERWTHFSWFSLFPVSEDTEENRRSFRNKSYVANADDSKFGGDEFTSALLDGVEAALVTLLEPRLNKQGGQWAHTMKLEQWSDFEHTSNDDLWEKLEEIEALLKK